MTDRGMAWLFHKSERAIALIELSCWMVFLLPLFVACAGLLAAAQERSVVRLVSKSLMREIGGSVLSWRPDRMGGEISPDIGRLDALIDSVAERAISEGIRGTFKLKRISALSCYWVYEIDSQSGSAGGLLISKCRSRGELGQELSLEEARLRRMELGIAQPIRIGSAGNMGYLPRAVLIGVVLGGTFDGIGVLCPAEIMQHASVWIPRRGIEL